MRGRPSRRRFRPDLIWTDGIRLVWAETFKINVRDDEIFRSDWCPCHSTKHCELTRMSHGIGEWALKQSLLSKPIRKFRPVFKMVCQIGKHFMKSRNLGVERCQGLGSIVTPDKEGAGVSKHTSHVPD